MALVVLRTYAMLSEAQVAAAALRAAGLEPVLLDQAAAPPYSGLISTGGFRLAVSEPEADAAVEVLRRALIQPVSGARDDEGEPEDFGAEPADERRDANPASAPRRPGRLGLLAGAALLAGAVAWAVRRATGL